MVTELVHKWWDDLRGHGRLRQLAWRLLRTKKFESASELIETGRKRFPGSISFEILLARYHLMANEYDLAIDIVNKFQRLKPNDVFDEFELAETYRLMHRYADATELFEKLKTTGRLDIPLLACQRLCSIYLRLEQPEHALDASVNCVRMGGWQRQELVFLLARTCSPESLRTAIAEAQAIKLTKFCQESQRLKFIASLATGIDRWELAIDLIGQATKQNFFAEYDAELWDDSQPPLRPSVLIIGAMKSGTTGLFKQLQSHPQFVAPLSKELHFFTNADWPDEFYFAQFPKLVSRSKPIVTGEASPGYYIFDIVDRVKRMLPEAKIAFIKRDPIERAVSHLFHNQASYIVEHRGDSLTKGTGTVLELCSLDEVALRAELVEFQAERKLVNRYLLMGCYDLLMRRWKTAYPREQILELEFHEFTTATQKTMDRMFDFVGVEPHKVDASFSSNVGKYRGDSVELVEIKKKLAEFYARVRALS